VTRGQLAGTLHSRTTENSIAAAKKANTSVRVRILYIMTRTAAIRQVTIGLKALITKSCVTRFSSNAA